MNDEASKIYGFTLISKAFFFSKTSLRYPDEREFVVRMETPVVLCFRHCFFNPVQKKRGLIL